MLSLFKILHIYNNENLYNKLYYIIYVLGPNN